MTWDPLLLLVDVLAVWRLTRLVTRDDFPPIKAAREWVLRRWPSGDTTFTAEEVVGIIEDPDAPAPFTGEGRVEGTGRPVFWNGEEWQSEGDHWQGKLISCLWCASVWLAAGVMALNPWRGWVAFVLGLLAVAGAAALVAVRLDPLPG